MTKMTRDVYGSLRMTRDDKDDKGYVGMSRDDYG